jgi:nucleotide-binding universal stress UspA family protein
MRTNHQRILVALSFEAGRDAAFERGLALARASGAELYLLHAVPATLPYSHRARERLHRSVELLERAAAAGVRARTAEQQGDPAEIILLHADNRAVDMIVMGTEQRAGWARWRRRSVAERVLSDTTRPTLVVRDDGGAGGVGFASILVAVDLTPASRAVIETTLRLAGGERRQLSVVHAVDVVDAVGDAWMVPDYRERVLDQARRQLELAIPPNLDDVTVDVATGLAADTIAVHAAEVDADLIAIGKRERFMQLGSTAVRLLRKTNRALLVVPSDVSASLVDDDVSVHDRAA